MTTLQAQSPASIFELLQQSQFLENFSESHLRTLSSFADSLEVSTGERIFREGDPADAVYLIDVGRVVLEICAPGIGCKQICTLSRGELLGWSPLLDQVRFTATARALEPTRLIRMNADQLRSACQQDMSLGYDFLRRTSNALAKRLSATRLQLIDVYGAQMPHGEETHSEPSEQKGAE
jgi:CRP/FNR family transcriptional regulator, cyclic AMP receptor protein